MAMSFSPIFCFDDIAGRSARAGKSGHSLLFLLPSERQYVEVLQLRGLKEITALSLSATLNSAANLCPSLSQEGDNARPSDKTFLDGKGEAFTLAIQNRLEQCVIQDDADYKASIEKKVKDAKQRRKLKKDTAGPLLVSARKAFSAFVRAYPAKERAVKHIFNARGLHLGHIARSLALREAPKVVSKVHSGAAVLNGEAIDKRKSKFELQISSHETDEDMRILSMVDKDLEEPGTKKRRKESSPKVMSLGKDTQKKMMEQAMRLQNQGMEFM
jgi:superfamily II DNA/RNA helicase